jgi:hypothetical protein
MCNCTFVTFYFKAINASSVHQPNPLIMGNFDVDDDDDDDSEVVNSDYTSGLFRFGILLLKLMNVFLDTR